VRILSTGAAPNNPNPKVAATMVSPTQSLTVGAQLSANTIEVQFTSAVDQASVVNGKSFVVNASTAAVMIGQFIFTAAATVRWVVQIPGSVALACRYLPHLAQRRWRLGHYFEWRGSGRRTTGPAFQQQCCGWRLHLHTDRYCGGLIPGATKESQKLRIAHGFEYVLR
jgi:hypothetical protein